MRKMFLVVLILSFTSAGLGAANLANNTPILFEPADSSEQPDAYGYTWVDSDNGGSPDFSWIDIPGSGVLVEGLADDNTVGPFDIGFNFPYYWYTVNSFYDGSNGYISFSSNANCPDVNSSPAPA